MKACGVWLRLASFTPRARSTYKCGHTLCVKREVHVFLSLGKDCKQQVVAFKRRGHHQTHCVYHPSHTPSLHPLHNTSRQAEGYSMTSSGSSSSSSSRGSLVLSFVAGAASASSLLYLFLHHHRQRQQQRLQQDQQQQQQKQQGQASSSNSSSSLPLSLEHELFARVLSFFGEASFPPIQQAFIVVVGLGGVGSHAAQMLVRSGVKRIRVVDFDQVNTNKWKKAHGKRWTTHTHSTVPSLPPSLLKVTLSSLNRHAVARLADVGLSKADVLKMRLLELGLPGLQIDARRALMNKESAPVLLGGWEGGKEEEGMFVSTSKIEIG